MLTLTLQKDTAGLFLRLDGDIEEVNQTRDPLCCLGERYTRHYWEKPSQDSRVIRLTPKRPYSNSVDMPILKRFLVQKQKEGDQTVYEFVNLLEEV